MSEANNKSGKAGKPGASERAKAASGLEPNKAGLAPVLTAASMANLLKAGFAAPAEVESERAETGTEAGEESAAAVTTEHDPAGESTVETAETEAETTGEAEGSEETAESEGEAAEETPEETAAEGSEDEDQSDAEANDETDEAEGEALPPGLQKRIDKRIGKLVAQREEARTAMAQEKAAREKAEAELKRLQANGEQAGATMPASVPPYDTEHLAKLEANAEAFLTEAEAFLDESATEAERDRVEFMASERLDAAGLKRRVREVGRWLTRELPQQREAITKFREQEKAIEPAAKKFFPWLDDPTTPEYQQAQEVLRLVPELKQRTPAHKLAQGIYVLGMQQLQKLQQEDAKKATPAAKPNAKPPSKAPVTGATRLSKPNPRVSQEETLRERMHQRPNRETVAELLKAGLRG